MRYFIGFLSVVALIIGVFIIVLKGFSSPAQPKHQIDLLDYANSQTVVRVTVDGPVNADQNHRGYRITVGRDANTIEVLQGYNQDVTDAKTYSNSTDAYATFLRALQLQNFTKGNTDPKFADYRGYCPNGYRYIFDIETAGRDVQHLWTTSCGGGTFKGNSNTIRGLFSRQIPDFSVMTGKIRWN